MLVIGLIIGMVIGANIGFICFAFISASKHK